MKRLFFSLLIIASLAAVTGCGGSKFKAGTYQGAAPGIHGKDVVLEVTVDKKNITDIRIIENHETPGVSDAAFERIPKAVMEQQNLNVDGVAGATYSSNAIIEAIGKALTAAGADIAALSSAEKSAADTVSSATQVLNADIVIIGAGGAGLSAAVSANQNGASVIVLEKMPQVGGNTIISGSAYNAVDPSRQEPDGIEDSVEKHYIQTYEGSPSLSPPS